MEQMLWDDSGKDLREVTGVEEGSRKSTREGRGSWGEGEYSLGIEPPPPLSGSKMEFAGRDRKWRETE
jgi:hypothetical protein